LFDAVEEGDELFLVMELLEGQSLERRLTGGPLAAAEAVEILSQILEALEELHKHQIVHCDLKPSNAFLTPHGVKLLDFGLARTAAACSGNATRQTATTITIPGLIAGTPHYMAPEQVQGLEAGPAADIFAAGSMLYEMLAGTRPFDGASVVDVLYAVVHHNPPPLAGSRQVEALDQVIRRALAKRKEDRYRSARDMRVAMSAVPLTAGATAGAERRIVTRLIALPFRVLRKDDETDFLAYSLPDAISSSLSGADGIIVRSILVMLGEKEEALARLHERERSGGATGIVRAIMQSLRAYLEGDWEGCLKAMEAGEPMMRKDSEVLFYEVRHLAQIDQPARALDVLLQVLDSGFWCGSSLLRDPWLAQLRSSPAYATLVMRAEQQRARIHASFTAAGGPALLNMA